MKKFIIILPFLGINNFLSSEVFHMLKTTVISREYDTLKMLSLSLCIYAFSALKAAGWVENI